MAGKLFSVEGASGSGKNTLLDCLAEKGNKIIRGIPSQNPVENNLLNKKSQNILNHIKVNIYSMRDNPADIFDRYINIMASQQEEAIDLKNKGFNVFFNRSIVSFFAHYFLVGKPELLEELKTLVKKIYSVFLTEINGIILMEEPIKGVAKEGIAGLQPEESQFINKFVEDLNKEKIVPVLKLNANAMTIDEETSKIQEFIQ